MAASWGSLPANARAAVWMLVTVCIFSTNNISLKHLTRELDPVQIMLLRSSVMALMMLPICLATHALATRRMGGHFQRAALGNAGAYLFIFALTLAPLADVVALSFSRSIFIVILAVLLLGESVGWRRWTAVGVGFVGVLIMVRPGFGELNWGVVAAAGDAIVSAGVALTLKSLGRTERPQTIVFYFGLFGVALTLVPAILFWRWPSEIGWLLVLLTGLLSTLGQTTNTLAWTQGDASIVAPIGYLQLVVSGVLDYFFFRVIPGPLTVLGAAVIVASTLYIALREAQRRKAVTS